MDARKMITNLSILLCAICGYAYAGISVADDASIPEKWVYVGTTPVEPIHAMYIGELDTLSYTSTTDHSAGKAIYSVWGKIVFKKQQQSKQGSYLTDIFDLKLDCHNALVSIMREIRMDDAGKVISDVKDVPGTKKVDPDFERNLGELPLDQGIAIAAWNDTCLSDVD